VSQLKIAWNLTLDCGHVVDLTAEEYAAWHRLAMTGPPPHRVTCPKCDPRVARGRRIELTVRRTS